MSDTKQGEDMEICVGRCGTFQDSRGSWHTFDRAALDEIVAAYDPARREAPLVIGHPEDDHPAWGWVRDLSRRADKLFARIAQVPAQVRDLVHNGRYRYVSMGLFPGGRSLRHIGLLGAVPPAIDGLGPVSLAGADGAVINFSSAQLARSTGATMDEELQRRLGTLEEQIRALSDQVRTLTEERDQARSEAAAAKEAKAAAESGAETVRAEFAAFRGEQEKKDRAARMEALVASGRVSPGEAKDKLAEAEALARIPEAVEFSDGQKERPVDRFFRQLEARQPSALLFSARPPAEETDGGAAPERVDLSRKL